jgi:hypothetical protein
VLNAFAASTIRFCHVEIDPQMAPANVPGGADWLDALDSVDCGDLLEAVVGPALGELSEQATRRNAATAAITTELNRRTVVMGITRTGSMSGT